MIRGGRGSRLRVGSGRALLHHRRQPAREFFFGVDHAFTLSQRRVKQFRLIPSRFSTLATHDPRMALVAFAPLHQRPRWCAKERSDGAVGGALVIVVECVEDLIQGRHRGEGRGWRAPS